jgi:hypothetical protein
MRPVRFVGARNLSANPRLPLAPVAQAVRPEAFSWVCLFWGSLFPL